MLARSDVQAAVQIETERRRALVYLGGVDD